MQLDKYAYTIIVAYMFQNPRTSLSTAKISLQPEITSTSYIPHAFLLPECGFIQKCINRYTVHLLLVSIKTRTYFAKSIKFANLLPFMKDSEQF